MIKKRTESGDIVRGLYESSNILASTYDKKSKALTITFNYGGQYTYTNVSTNDFTRFETAESQGKVLNSHIKNVYETVNNGKVDTTLIKESLDKAIKDEVYDYLKSVMDDMNLVIGDFATSKTVDVYRLDDLTKRFETYKGML